jgi:hypothetical protein
VHVPLSRHWFKSEFGKHQQKLAKLTKLIPQPPQSLLPDGVVREVEVPEPLRPKPRGQRGDRVVRDDQGLQGRKRKGGGKL